MSVPLTAVSLPLSSSLLSSGLLRQQYPTSPTSTVQPYRGTSTLNAEVEDTFLGGGFGRERLEGWANMSIPMLPCIRLLILQYTLNSGIQIQVVSEGSY